MSHRIILADTQVIFRAGAARVLAAASDIHVAAQCADLQQLHEAVIDHGNSVVVFPSSLSPNLHEVLDMIEHAGSKSVVIVEHGATLDNSVAQRAAGILPRSVAGPELLDCVRRVSLGERCFQTTEPRIELRPDSVGTRILQQLTPKELQILALVSDGAKNKEIATLLGTKEQVIKNYLRSIYDKTGVSDRLELTLFTLHHPALAEAAERARQQLRRST